MNKSQVVIGDSQRIIDSPKQLSHNMSQEQVSDVLVLDACECQALATVRSLGSHGLHIAVLGTGNDAPAFASRWCQRKFVCPAKEGTEAYLTFLEYALEQSGARVIIPCSDTTISLLRQHREQLEPRVRIALAKESALEIVLDKERMLSVAKQIGLNVPLSVTIRDGRQVDAALRDVGLPAIIKPIEPCTANSQKDMNSTSFLAVTRDEAYHAVETLLTHSANGVIFQQFLSCECEATSFLYAQGQIFAKFACAIKRTALPLGGISVLRRSIAILLDISEQAELLVRAIDLEGYCDVEFCRDRTGYPYVVNINPRLSASVGLAITSDVDFPYLLYQWVSGEQVNPVKYYQVDRHMCYLSGDIATKTVLVRWVDKSGMTSSLLAALGFCLAFLIPMWCDYFNWYDLRPLGQGVINWFHALPVYKVYIRRAFSSRERER